MGNADSKASVSGASSSCGSAPTSPTAIGAPLSSRPTLTPEDVAALPLIPHYVYACLAEHCYMEPDRRPLPAGWRVLMTAEETRLDREGYFAVAFINERLRHCIIAERGTQDALGLRAGVWMYFDEPTIQCYLAEQFSKLVRLRLSLTDSAAADSGLAPYFVSYTGHSLGAVLAACRACAEHTYAITFESPGCRAFVEKTMHPFRADDADIITYQRAPNPINTLKPQMGYLVMLPYADPPPALAGNASAVAAAAGSVAGGVLGGVAGSEAGSGGVSTHALSNNTVGSAIDERRAAAAAAAGGSASTTAAVVPASTRTKLSLPSFPSPQEYLRNKILTQTFPEIQIYLTKLEPVMRELFNTTQQHHSIRSIVSNFEGAAEGGEERRRQDVIMAWPSHIMQFLEVFNIVKAMDEPANQDPNVRTAYRELLNRLYHVKERPRNKLPLRFLNRDSQKILKIWAVLRPDQLAKIPLAPIDRRALNSASIESHSMVSNILTAFQMKQYLALLVARPEVSCFLDNFSGDLGSTSTSKL